jgi:hypothetical protein
MTYFNANETTVQKNNLKIKNFFVVPPGIEPGTHGFSVHCSTI